VGNWGSGKPWEGKKLTQFIWSLYAKRILEEERKRLETHDREGRIEATLMGPQAPQISPGGTKGLQALEERKKKKVIPEHVRKVNSSRRCEL